MSGFVRLSVVFVLGAALGVWTFIEPWVIHYPFATRHQWTPSMWSNAWTGAVVTAVSLVGLGATVAVGLRSAVRAAQPADS